MNIATAIIVLAAGLVILCKAADLLVTAAVRLAAKLGVSPLVIGLTVVAMGTSAPEVAASIAAALRNAGDIAIGNVYGSNIANLALVGGLVAIIRPLETRKKTLQREIPVMLAAALLLWPVLNNLFLSRLESLLLLAVFAILIILTVYAARKEATTRNTTDPKTHSRPTDNAVLKNILLCSVGLVGLALGAKMTLAAAVFLGHKIGLSEAVIGLTIIAIGTSLPELVTCVVAALKGHHDISVGNLVGSNVFNTLLVTGIAGTVRPFHLAERLIHTDYWVMIIVSAAFACAVIVGRRTIGRLSGTLLVCGYLAYMAYLAYMTHLSALAT
jgi:cation:H+ antiporter